MLPTYRSNFAEVAHTTKNVLQACSRLWVGRHWVYSQQRHGCFLFTTTSILAEAHPALCKMGIRGKAVGA